MLGKRREARQRTEDFAVASDRSCFFSNRSSVSSRRYARVTVSDPLTIRAIPDNSLTVTTYVLTLPYY